MDITESPTTNSWKNTSFPELEKNIINFWKENNIVEKIIEYTKKNPRKIFLDGPPFATGTPHYGHILVSTVKDTMLRYLTMKGYYVDRNYGYDCHGVPIEMIAKKKIGYVTKQDLIEFGIDKHNKICKELVLNCTDQWIKYFERIGRWVDPNGEYKTIDTKFMESVVWIFKQLYTNGLIFKGYKVMPYSTGCHTPLSHFEAKQNYKIVSDPSIICMFEIISTEYSYFKINTSESIYLLVWTTTPWTLPSNLALCTHTSIELSYIYDLKTKCYFILSSAKFESNYFKLEHNGSKRFILIDRIFGQDLVNAEYKPPFTYFWSEEKLKNIPIKGRAFRVVSDPFVKDSGDGSGTGFVHLAPTYGEEDFRVCCSNGIIDSKNSNGNLIDTINEDGCFLPIISDYEGIYVKKADNLIIKDLEKRNLLFDSKKSKHSYPYCYRTETPLLYRLVSGWFLNASDNNFRNKMLTNNTKINWLPENIGTNHFDNWLQGSVDWCISRSRYWGTPIPIWASDDGEEMVCVGSIKELYELSNVKVKDLHLEYIDSIQIPSKQGKGMLKRVEGVLDCWFESGAMPYAQLHYPFENENLINPEKESISDFITESKDQTRGWFYTLNVLSTALFDKPAFGNVIVTGIINGTDGEKMAKSKGNYPDPYEIINKYGADSLRFYMLSTPVVKAESIIFEEHHIKKLQQNSIVKIYNITLFLIEKIQLYNKQFNESFYCPDKKEVESFKNILDKWIINKTGLLLKEIDENLSKYKINCVAQKILDYIEQLTNWYCKMARERLKGSTSRFNDHNIKIDWKQGLQTLLFVIYQFIIIVAPILPFITEAIYQMIKSYLKKPLESIHYISYPELNEFIFNPELEIKFEVIQNAITLIREIRDSLKLNHRRPIDYVEIGCINLEHWEIIQDVLDYVKIESNVIEIKQLDYSNMLYSKATPLLPKLSNYLKANNKIKKMNNVIKFINNLDQSQINDLQQNKILVNSEIDVEITENLVDIKYILKNPSIDIKIKENMIIKLNDFYSERVEKEHLTRLINSAIQMHRKEKNMKPWNIIDVFFHTESMKLNKFIRENIDLFLSNNIRSLSPLAGYGSYNPVFKQVTEQPSQKGGGSGCSVSVFPKLILEPPPFRDGISFFETDTEQPTQTNNSDETIHLILNENLIIISQV